MLASAKTSTFTAHIQGQRRSQGSLFPVVLDDPYSCRSYVPRHRCIRREASALNLSAIETENVAAEPTETPAEAHTDAIFPEVA